MPQNPVNPVNEVPLDPFDPNTIPEIIRLCTGMALEERRVIRLSRDPDSAFKSRLAVRLIQAYRDKRNYAGRRNGLDFEIQCYDPKASKYNP